jgi:repressor LexA
METIFTNIKERILHYTDFKGLAKEKFFENLGVTYGNFKGEAKKKALSSDVLAKIVSMYPDISTEWLLTGKGEMIKGAAVENTHQSQSENIIPLIPIEAMAGKGNGSVQILKKDIIDGYVIPEFTQRGVEYIIRVSGSSMYPKYSSGDLLGCRTVTDTSFFQWGKIYVLDTDQGPMVKRLFPIADNPDSLECRSDNKEYPPFPISKTSIYKIAIVVGVLRLE